MDRLFKEILKLPKFGCINIHASLLPKYRGAAPIQQAVIDGEKVSGVTIQQMGEGLDTGDMISKIVIQSLRQKQVEACLENLRRPVRIC